MNKQFLTEERRREQLLDEMGLRAKSGYSGNRYEKVGGDSVSPPKTTADIAEAIGGGVMNKQFLTEERRATARFQRELKAVYDFAEYIFDMDTIDFWKAAIGFTENDFALLQKGLNLKLPIVDLKSNIAWKIENIGDIITPILQQKHDCIKKMLFEAAGIQATQTIPQATQSTPDEKQGIIDKALAELLGKCIKQVTKKNGTKEYWIIETLPKVRDMINAKRKSGRIGDIGYTDAFIKAYLKNKTGKDIKDALRTEKNRTGKTNK